MAALKPLALYSFFSNVCLFREEKRQRGLPLTYTFEEFFWFPSFIKYLATMYGIHRTLKVLCSSIMNSRILF